MGTGKRGQVTPQVHVSMETLKKPPGVAVARLCGDRSREVGTRHDAGSGTGFGGSAGTAQ